MASPAKRVRVLGGEFKGQRLRYPKDPRFRPTMQRVKASVFDRLAPMLPGSVFVDLFCAAGGMGIEALSRGATFVHFVDGDGAALALARRNLETCQVDQLRYRLCRSHGVAWLGRRILPPPQIIYADPPYGSSLAAAVLAAMSPRLVTSLAMVVVEDRGPVGQPSSRTLELVAEVSFGDTMVSFFQPRRRR